MDFKRLNNLTGWLVFAIAAAVYYLSAEPSGSLWDCGEFISAADKLQVVHPPGAPLFLMVGRLFAWVGSLFSSAPETPAFAINFLSGICGAFNALFVFWITTILGKLALVGRDGELETPGEIVSVLAGGVIAGLAATFATSVWFSAVEGEVYAMSGFFTAMMVWATMRWYIAPESKDTDRWLLFAAFTLGLSSTVHLLSLLTIPVVTMLYYLKRYENPKPVGLLGSFGIGVVLLGFFQFFVIPVIPTIGANFDFIFVNSLGMPFGSGLLFFIILITGGIVALDRYAIKNNKPRLQKSVLAFGLVLLGFSSYAIILVRANANTPLNMNDPSDPYTLVSYLKREQYGERPLFYGPQFNARQLDKEDGDRLIPKGKVYKPVNGRYEVVDEKFDVQYNPADYTFFPRMGHSEPYQVEGYMDWMGMDKNNPADKEAIASNARPTMGDNISFMLRYQIGWMYWRYFFWNFVGRQNAEQGFGPQDPSSGNWISGIPFVDNRLYDQSGITPDMKSDPSRNTYYFLPLIFGLIGMYFHFKKRPNEAMTVLVLFIMTGIAIVMYLNEPPREPRERDYGFAGSFFTFCIWIGLSAPAIYSLIKNYISGLPAGLVAALPIVAPLIMGQQNWDDHSRAGHYAARDYAQNFLQSVDQNAIIFTYGDNDTYPLWYAQEVEGIRRDVRVINFSLLAVDWYINQLRRKINDSEAIKMSIPEDGYRGELRNYLQVNSSSTNEMELKDLIKFMGESHPVGGGQMPSYIPTPNVKITVDKAKAIASKWVSDVPDSLILDVMRFKINKSYLQKDEIAMMDIIGSNFLDRPVYFAVTVRPEKIMGIKPYLQLEGLGLRIVPVAAKEDPTFGGGVLGYGRVDANRCYDVIMNKWRYGNFDKMKTFVDRSYLPSVQSMQFVVIRTAEELIDRGEKEKAALLTERYLQSFPHYNFPLEKNNGATFIQILYDAGAPEKAQEAVLNYTTSYSENLKFYATLCDKSAMIDWLSSNDEISALADAINQLRDGNNPEDMAKSQEMMKAYQTAREKQTVSEGRMRASDMAVFLDDFKRASMGMSRILRVVRGGSNESLKQQVGALLSDYLPVVPINDSIK